MKSEEVKLLIDEHISDVMLDYEKLTGLGKKRVEAYKLASLALTERDELKEENELLRDRISDISSDYVKIAFECKDLKFENLEEENKRLKDLLYKSIDNTGRAINIILKNKENKS